MSPDDHPALASQPVPAAACCPECGGDPAPTVSHRLSALGYTHDDQAVVCADCGHQWVCGVPIGEFDRPELAADLMCSCGGYRLVHRVASRGGGAITLQLKCPDCYSYTKARRELDDRSIALVGYPQTTGQTEGCPPYGYAEGALEDTHDD